MPPPLFPGSATCLPPPPVTASFRVLFAVLLILPAARAASVPAAQQLPPVVVTDLLPADPSRAPGAAGTLDRAELERWVPLTLHDALAFIAGVRTIDDDAHGRRSGIAIRGAPARRSRKVLLLEDGTPINASTYLDPSVHYTPPLERIERIEVLKGAGHLLHGPMNNHGIVNFRTLRPTAEPATVLEVAGGWPRTIKRHVRHTGPAGPFGLALAYTAFDADGVFDLERTRFTDGFAAVSWHPAASHELRFAFTTFRERSHYDESNLTPAEFSVDSFRKRGRFRQEFNTFALDVHKADLVHHWQPGAALTLSTKVFVSEFDRPRFTIDPGATPVALLPRLTPDAPFDPAARTGQMIARDREYRSFGFESRAESGSGRAWQAGLRAERQLLNDRRTAGGAGEILHAGNRGTRTRDEPYRAGALSGFLQRALHRDRVTLTPGLRLEHYTQSKGRNSLPSDPGPHPAARREHRTLLLPAVALQGPAPHGSWFASIGRGYTPAFARTAAGFPLRPEMGWNSQAGWRWGRPGVPNLEAAVFHNRIRDTVVQLPFTLDHRDIYLNSEHSESLGADLAVRWSAAPPLTAAAQPFAELTYNYTEARFTHGAVSGRRVPEVPRHAGSMSFGFESPRRWQASVTLSHNGAFFTDPANTRELTLANEDGVPLGPGDELEIREPVVFGRVASRTLLSARASVEVDRLRVTFWIQGRNLLDRLYVADLQNGLRPGARRSVVIGATLRR